MIPLLAAMIGCESNITSPSLYEKDGEDSSPYDGEELEDGSSAGDESGDDSQDVPGSGQDEESSDNGQDGSGSGSDEGEDDAGDETVVPVNPNYPSFTKIELFTDMPGAAWLDKSDLDGDGFDEYLVTCISEGVGDWPTFIGAGAAYVVSRDGGAAAGEIGTWSSEMIFNRNDEIDWPNDNSLLDVNNDGVKDWLIGTDFIPIPNGGIVWMEGYVEDGVQGFSAPAYVDTPWTDHFYHKAYPLDMDNDGDMDFVTTNYRNPETDWLGNELAPGIAKMEWFENNGIVGEASFTHHEIAERGGALLALHDIDGDGDQDIVAPQYFSGDALIWLENNGPDAEWTEHTINATTGRGFDVELADMNGDGRLDILYGNHNHQGSTVPAEQTMGVYWFEIPPADELDGLDNWDSTMNVVVEGFYVDEEDVSQNGAPGVFHAGDADGDGLMDVSVSGDGDDGLYVFFQEEDGSFGEQLLDIGTIMGGDHIMSDLDGDGDMDFIWAIYGELDLFSGQIAPTSFVNIYLQD